MIKYEYAPEIKSKVLHICSKLDFKHVDMNRVACFRSFGSSSNNQLAVIQLRAVTLFQLFGKKP